MRLLHYASPLILLVSFTQAQQQSSYDPIQMLCLVNQQRIQNGARPLGINSDLTGAAEYHSQDQVNMHTMTHSDSRGRSLGERITAAGYTDWTSVGENVAYGYPNEQTCMTAWMNSPGHRENILNPAFTHFGSAVRYDGSTPYYTQDFAGDGRTYNFPVCPSDNGSGDYNDDGVQSDSVGGRIMQPVHQLEQMFSPPPQQMQVENVQPNTSFRVVHHYTFHHHESSNGPVLQESGGDFDGPTGNQDAIVMTAPPPSSYTGQGNNYNNDEDDCSSEE